MEEGMTAQSFNSLDPCCFRISAGGKVGAAQLLQRGKEHVMMFNYSWKREGIQYKKNQQAQAPLLQGYYYVYWYLLILVLFLHDQLWDLNIDECCLKFFVLHFCCADYLDGLG
ncbi:unnamed protein product [Brassica oleracea]